MRLNQYTVLASLFTYSHAWPWPPAEGLFRRQNGGNTQTTAQTSNSNIAQITTAPTATTASPTTTGRLVSANGGNRPISLATGGNSTATEYDPRDPAGGISMLVPAATNGPQYYKIGDWVHFAWNYTSLSATPTAINIVASCKAQQATHTLAMNQSVAPTGEIYWDTGAYQASAAQQLITHQYTLIVYDAAQSISAVPKPGYLGSYAQFTFGMYTPQPYVPWNEFQNSCPTCSGAMSLERMTITALLGMVSITVLTFSWFISNANIL